MFIQELNNEKNDDMLVNLNLNEVIRGIQRNIVKYVPASKLEENAKDFDDDDLLQPETTIDVQGSEFTDNDAVEPGLNIYLNNKRSSNSTSKDIMFGSGDFSDDASGVSPDQQLSSNSNSNAENGYDAATGVTNTMIDSGSNILSKIGSNAVSNTDSNKMITSPLKTGRESNQNFITNSDSKAVNKLANAIQAVLRESRMKDEQKKSASNSIENKIYTIDFSKEDGPPSDDGSISNEYFHKYESEPPIHVRDGEAENTRKVFSSHLNSNEISTIRQFDDLSRSPLNSKYTKSKSKDIILNLLNLLRNRIVQRGNKKLQSISRRNSQKKHATKADALRFHRRLTALHNQIEHIKAMLNVSAINKTTSHNHDDLSDTSASQKHVASDVRHASSDGTLEPTQQTPNLAFKRLEDDISFTPVDTVFVGGGNVPSASNIPAPASSDFSTGFKKFIPSYNLPSPKMRSFLSTKDLLLPKSPAFTATPLDPSFVNRIKSEPNGLAIQSHAVHSLNNRDTFSNAFAHPLNGLPRTSTGLNYISTGRELIAPNAGGRHITSSTGDPIISGGDRSHQNFFPERVQMPNINRIAKENQQRQAAPILSKSEVTSYDGHIRRTNNPSVRQKEPVTELKWHEDMNEDKNEKKLSKETEGRENDDSQKFVSETKQMKSETFEHKSGNSDSKSSRHKTGRAHRVKGYSNIIDNIDDAMQNNISSTSDKDEKANDKSWYKTYKGVPGDHSLKNENEGNEKTNEDLDKSKVESLQTNIKRRYKEKVEPTKESFSSDDKTKAYSYEAKARSSYTKNDETQEHRMTKLVDRLLKTAEALQKFYAKKANISVNSAYTIFKNNTTSPSNKDDGSVTIETLKDSVEEPSQKTLISAKPFGPDGLHITKDLHLFKIASNRSHVINGFKLANETNSDDFPPTIVEKNDEDSPGNDVIIPKESEKSKIKPPEQTIEDSKTFANGSTKNNDTLPKTINSKIQILKDNAPSTPQEIEKDKQVSLSTGVPLNRSLSSEGEVGTLEGRKKVAYTAPTLLAKISQASISQPLPQSIPIALLAVPNLPAASPVSISELASFVGKQEVKPTVTVGKLVRGQSNHFQPYATTPAVTRDLLAKSDDASDVDSSKSSRVISDIKFIDDPDSGNDATMSVGDTSQDHQAEKSSDASVTVDFSKLSNSGHHHTKDSKSTDVSLEEIENQIEKFNDNPELIQDLFGDDESFDKPSKASNRHFVSTNTMPYSPLNKPVSQDSLNASKIR